jgi:hypothetical protein
MNAKSFHRFFLITLLMTGCGAQSNIIGRTVPDSHKNNYFHSLDMAQSLYDQGRLLEARKYAKNAYTIDPESEEAAVLFGFISLSLAGGDPFSLAKGLIKAENERKKAASAGEVSTGDTLGSIKDVVGFSQGEIESLGTKETSDNLYPVLLPKCAEDVRINVERLIYVTEAIVTVCPFVDENARIETDSRHLCNATQKRRKFQNKAHFLWAFTHLTEAVAFNAVLNYKNANSLESKTNLEKRVEKVQAIDASSPQSLDSLLTSLESIETTINSIFPAGGSCSQEFPTSQLQATLNDMLAVDLAFGKIVGIPAGIVSSLLKVVAKIKGVGDTDLSIKLAAIKGDFTKKVSSGLSAKVDQLAADPTNPLDPSKKIQLCNILDSISSGTDTSETCK